MSDDMKVHDDLKSLANGINFAIASLNDGKVMEFLFILVRPNEDGTVTLNTITAITEPHKIRMIGQHLVDMANVQAGAQLDPDSDNDVQGHA